MANFWLSWWVKKEDGDFELHWPWWISGMRDSDDAESACAGVRAENEDAAKAMILAAYDNPPASLEWRFCEPRPEGWSPFSDRFRRVSWMQWK